MLKALALATFVLLIIYFSSTALHSASAVNTQNNGWHVSYSLGKFSNAEPPKSDQIFKIYYRVVNGTVVDSVDTPPLQVIANVTSGSGEAVLEIRYPRNYPYTNDPNPTSAGADNFIAYVQRAGGPEKQIPSNGTLTDCFFALSIPFKGTTYIKITSSFIPEENFGFHGDDVPESCVSETTAEQNSISPLAQIKAGVSTENIVCKEGLERIMHPDGKPYCVSSKSIGMIKERWNIT